MADFAEEAGGEPAFEGALGHAVAFGHQEAGAGLEALGQFIVDGLLHPGEFIDGAVGHYLRLLARPGGGGGEERAERFF